MMDYLNYILLPFLLLGFALFVPGFLLASIADARAGVVKNLAVAPAISFFADYHRHFSHAVSAATLGELSLVR